jgi:hypothetical protein
MSGEITIDGEVDLPIFSPICSKCRHVNMRYRLKCTAFPDGIPAEIWKGDNPHQTPVDGDHGIRFEARPPA